MLVNISFIKLKGNVKDNYTQSLKGFKNKDVEWDKLRNVLSNSKVQFSPYFFKNGVKRAKNWSNKKQNMLVVDIDDDLSISQCQQMFRKYKYLIGTTKSHQKIKKGKILDRYRLCIPAINIPTDKDIYFRMLSLLFPFNDEQTEHPTSAFLGNDEAIIIYNDGKLLDCFKASELAYEQIEQERVEKLAKKIDKDLLDYKGKNSIEELKKKLNQEIIIEILNSIGIELIGNKFRLREERTPSTKLYPSGLMKDYGSGKTYDIFAILIEHQNMSFRDAMNYVRNFV